ncbi:MAG: hypothetical protein QXU99_03780 [Candidatus Bathyarchaeia archaeon]
MVKPFELTGESRYLGLPLGFGFLGVSYAISAISYYPTFDFAKIGWLQLYIRGAAFLFLAVTYYFSKSANKSHLLWDIALGMIGSLMAILVLFTIISPEISLSDYKIASICVRVISLICLCYISIHALKSHIEQPDPTTLTAPFGYVFLAIGQYSLLIWIIESSYFAFFGALAFRLTGLGIFLYVAYKGFYSKERIDK